MEILMLSAATMIGGYIIIRRLMPKRFIVKFRGLLDLCFTGALLAVFGGTLTGALIAMVAGLMFSALLFILKISVQEPDHRRKTAGTVYE